MKNHSIVALLAAVSFGVICTNCSSVVTALDNMTASLEAANAKLEAQNAASRAARESRTTTTTTATASTPNTSATTTATTTAKTGTTTTKTSNSTTASAKATTQNTTAATTTKTNSTTTTQTNTITPSTTPKTTTTTPANVDSRAVDLGLSVLWASCNVGATRPEEFGNYYAWGETKPKKTEEYVEKKYKFYGRRDRSRAYFYKYCCSTHSMDGKGDDKKVLEPEDDAASVNWGSKWHTPTNEEWDELINYTTDEWTEINGIHGRKYTSIRNGNSIFLPAAGEKSDGFDKTDNEGGTYWSGSLEYRSFSLAGSEAASVWDFFWKESAFSATSRCTGLPVRPVHASPTWKVVETPTLTLDIIEVKATTSKIRSLVPFGPKPHNQCVEVCTNPYFRNGDKVECYPFHSYGDLEINRLKPNTKYYLRVTGEMNETKDIFYSNIVSITTLK